MGTAAARPQESLAGPSPSFSGPTAHEVAGALQASTWAGEWTEGRLESSPG